MVTMMTEKKIMGVSMGRVILKNTWRLLAPSSRAAS